MIKTCPICGKEFETKVEHKRFCSPECKKEKDNFARFAKYHHEKPDAQIISKCRERYGKHLNPELIQSRKSTCIVCGKEFETKVGHKKFCSVICQQRYFRKKHKPLTKCLVCGKEFESSNGRLLCSPECAKERRLILKRVYHTAKPAKIVTCAICKKEFEATVYNRKYCSAECLRIGKAIRACERFHKKNPNARYITKNTMVKRKAKATPIVRKSEIGICKECGREFKVKSLTPEYYCSEECELKSLHRKQNLYSATTFIWLKDFVRQSWSRQCLAR